MGEAPAWLRALPARVSALGEGYFADFAPPEEADRYSAVLILVAEDPEGGEDVLLTERGSRMRAHAGQVSFPGGRVDPGDRGAIGAALREAEEEVGVTAESVEVIGQLPGLYLSPSQNVVTPILGWWHSPTPVKPVSTFEVERVQRVRIADLVDPANRFMVTTPIGYRSPGWDLHGLFIWGFTAKLLDVLLGLAGLAEPWDESRDVPLPQQFHRLR